MADQQDGDKARTDAEKAKDYFSKIPGFQPAATEKPAPEEAEKEAAPAVPAKPEPPLSEAEKYFKGLIDEVRIYNRPLSPSEIQVDMATPIQ